MILTILYLILTSSLFINPTIILILVIADVIAAEAIRELINLKYEDQNKHAKHA